MQKHQEICPPRQNRLKFSPMTDTLSTYDLMDSAPQAARIRAFHPPSLDESRAKLFMFLSGWSGGPSLYMERYGHPRLRMRHLPFLIGVQERDEWLWCMHKALDEAPIPPETVAFLKERFTEIADNMRNRPEVY
jgi:hemoglobin